jgi:CrcB protein
MRVLFWIAVFGTLGCWARYGQSLLLQSLSGRAFPLAVMSVNIVGSFIMGFLAIETMERLALTPALRVGLLTGFLGGYTTFSSFELETLLLAESGETAKAVLYVGLSVGVGFLGVMLGAFLARRI